MDEVVERVAGGVAVEMHAETRGLGLRAVGADVLLTERPDPIQRRHVGRAEDPLLGGRVEVSLLLRVRFVREPDHQLAALHRDRRLLRELEAPLLARRLLHVAMLAFGGIDEPEMHAHRVRGVFRSQAERVVAQILAGLDVILIRVGPVEFHFLALVRDGVHAGLVHALREEIAFGVVAAEEGVQVVVDLGLERVQVHSILSQPGAQLLDLGERLWIGTQPLCLLNSLRQLPLDCRLVGRLVLRERRLHLGQQILLQELRHLRALGVHHAVEAEVQVGLIELEQLL